LSGVEAGIIESDAQSPVVIPPFCVYTCLRLLTVGNVKFSFTKVLCIVFSRHLFLSCSVEATRPWRTMKPLLLTESLGYWQERHGIITICTEPRCRIKSQTSLVQNCSVLSERRV